METGRDFRRDDLIARRQAGMAAVQAHRGHGRAHEDAFPGRRPRHLGNQRL